MRKIKKSLLIMGITTLSISGFIAGTTALVSCSTVSSDGVLSGELTYNDEQKLIDSLTSIFGSKNSQEFKSAFENFINDYLSRLNAEQRKEIAVNAYRNSYEAVEDNSSNGLWAYDIPIKSNAQASQIDGREKIISKNDFVDVNSFVVEDNGSIVISASIDPNVVNKKYTTISSTNYFGLRRGFALQNKDFELKLNASSFSDYFFIPEIFNSDDELNKKISSIHLSNPNKKIYVGLFKDSNGKVNLVFKSWYNDETGKGVSTGCPGTYKFNSGLDNGNHWGINAFGSFDFKLPIFKIN